MLPELDELAPLELLLGELLMPMPSPLPLASLLAVTGSTLLQADTVTSNAHRAARMTILAMGTSVTALDASKSIE